MEGKIGLFGRLGWARKVKPAGGLFCPEVDRVGVR